MIAFSREKKGFTLVELVIVIVILGIISALAIPKFIDLTSSARTAKTEGVFAALKSAVHLAHAQWLAKGKPSNITLQGTVLPMSTNGWPGSYNMHPYSCKEVISNLLSTNIETSNSYNSGSDKYFIYGSSKSCTIADVKRQPVLMLQYNTETGTFEQH